VPEPDGRLLLAAEQADSGSGQRAPRPPDTMGDPAAADLLSTGGHPAIPRPTWSSPRPLSTPVGAPCLQLLGGDMHDKSYMVSSLTTPASSSYVASKHPSCSLLAAWPL